MLIRKGRLLKSRKVREASIRVEAFIRKLRCVVMMMSQINYDIDM